MGSRSWLPGYAFVPTGSISGNEYNVHVASVMNGFDRYRVACAAACADCGLVKVSVRIGSVGAEVRCASAYACSRPAAGDEESVVRNLLCRWTYCLFG